MQKKQSVLYRTPHTCKSNKKTQSTLQNDNQFAETKAFLQEKHKKQPYLPFIVIHVTLNLPPLDITPLTPHP